MSISLAVGSRLPAYASSMGRVLLSGLSPQELDRFLDEVELLPLTERTLTDRARLRDVISQVQQRGWAMVDQEVEVGVRSVAAPILDRSGRVLAAVNISSHASRVTIKDLRSRFLPLVQDAARRISANFVGSPA
jgi:IclR family pca regulon transcriptional regulator